MAENVPNKKGAGKRKGASLKRRIAEEVRRPDDERRQMRRGKKVRVRTS